MQWPDRLTTDWVAVVVIVVAVMILLVLTMEVWLPHHR